MPTADASDAPPPPPAFQAGSGVPMSTDRLRWCIDLVGWSPRELARQAPTSEDSCRAMVRGRKRVPDELAEWVEELVALVLRGPRNWRNSATVRDHDEAA